jgi:hypothetical protein
LSKKHPATTRVLLEAIRGGLSKKFAAKLAGIDQATVRNWRETDPLFARELEAARAEFVQKHVGRIDNHSKRNWMASAWLLERTEPRDFGPAHAQLSINQTVATGPTNVVVLGPERAKELADRHQTIRAKSLKLLDAASHATNGNGNDNANTDTGDH